MVIGSGIVIVRFGGGRNPLFTPIFIDQMEYGIIGILIRILEFILITNQTCG